MFYSINSVNSVNSVKAVRCSPHLWWNYFDLQIIDVKLTSLLTVGKWYVKKSLLKNSLLRIFYNFFLVFFCDFFIRTFREVGWICADWNMRCQIFVKNRAFTKSAPTFFHFNTKRRKRRKRQKRLKGQKRQKETQYTF